jgi:hypothetical protein
MFNMEMVFQTAEFQSKMHKVYNIIDIADNRIPISGYKLYPTSPGKRTTASLS